MSGLQSKTSLNNIFYFCVTGLSNSATNWTASQSNCKAINSKENHATDICDPNKDTVKTGMWTNIFRVEISAHVDYGNTFDNNKRIYIFILQSLHLIYTYTIRVHFCFSSPVPYGTTFYVLFSPVSDLEVYRTDANNQC